MSEQQAKGIRSPTIAGATELERLVARSRLIGADPALVVHGGGNTSSKMVEVDHRGRERMVLRIKGSGTDLKTIGPDGFPGLHLDELLPLRDRAAMTDEEMVDYLAHCMVEPGSRRPSIETLLHAFLPARHVDHVHADAICALTNTADPERHVRAALGPDVAIVPYIRPGFALSQQVANLTGASAVVLAKHGLVTWGDSHEESYDRTLDLVARAEAYLAARARPRPATAPDLDAATVETLCLSLRGLLSKDDERCVLFIDRTQRDFAHRSDVDLVATAGRATPDHILRIGARSLVVRDPASVADAVATFVENYRAYFARHRRRLPSGLAMRSPLPRVVLVPGLGCIAAGPDARAARVNAEIAAHSHLVTARVLDAFGEVDWLAERDIFDFDYWPLELYKLKSAPPPRDFSGKIAIVTGAASEVGRTVVDRLAGDGAHVLVAGNNMDGLEQLVAAYPGIVRRAEDNLVSSAIAAFGGVDILVALTPIASDELNRLMAAFRQQGNGGAIVGLASESGTTVNLGRVPSDQPHVNTLRIGNDSEPAQVAEVIAFLASTRSAAINHATLPLGAEQA